MNDEEEIAGYANILYEGGLAKTKLGDGPLEVALDELVERTYDRLIHKTEPGKMKEVIARHTRVVLKLSELHVGRSLLQSVDAAYDFRPTRLYVSKDELKRKPGQDDVGLSLHNARKLDEDKDRGPQTPPDAA